MSGYLFRETMSVVEVHQKGLRELSLVEIKKRYEKRADTCKAFLKEQDDIEEVVTIEHPKGGKLETSISEMIPDVVSYGTYYRGNITAMLRQ